MQTSKIGAGLALFFGLLAAFPLAAEESASGQTPSSEAGASGQAPSFEDLFHDGIVLISSPHQLGETFPSQHYKEGFLQEDLLDFIFWLEESTVSPNPALMSLVERKAFLARYLDFMAGPAYLGWLNDRHVSESLFEQWLKVWQALGIHERNLFHERSLEVKRRYLELGTAPALFVVRNTPLFSRNDSGQLIPLQRPFMKMVTLGAPEIAGDHHRAKLLIAIGFGCAFCLLLIWMIWRAFREPQRP